MHAGLDPIFRRPDKRNQWATLAGEALSNANLHDLGILAPVLGKILQIAAGSARGVRTHYRLQRRFGRRSLWRAFEVPGL
jgi:hypothetical protein